MPRKKNWKKSECRRAMLNRGGLEESSDSQRMESPVSVQAQSPASMQATSPVSVQAQSPVSVQAQSPGSLQAQSPVNMQAQSSVSVQKNQSKSEIVNKSENKQSSYAQFQHIQSRTTECQQTALTQFQSSDLAQNPLANDDRNTLCSELVFRSSEQSWNACHIVFGSFHQNDRQFSEHSRGFQCTGNAFCMLSYSACHEIDKSSTLDKILCDGDALYQTIINNLKAYGKFIHFLLSLDEIPDVFEVEIGKFIVEKQSIISGILVDTHEEHGLSTLHHVLNSTFTIVSSGLLIIGAICSAVFKKNGRYSFFDSHSHGQNGLSSGDGTSIMISFSCLDDLVIYLYAFYDSMKIDMSLQFDFLPVNVRKSNKQQSSKDQLESCLVTYFKDQKLRQARKAQSKVGCIDVPTETSGAKKKKRTSRTEYYKKVKRNQRGKEGVLTKEYAKKKTTKTKPHF